MNEYIQKQRLLEQLQMGQFGWRKRSHWDRTLDYGKQWENGCELRGNWQERHVWGSLACQCWLKCRLKKSMTKTKILCNSQGINLCDYSLPSHFLLILSHPLALREQGTPWCDPYWSAYWAECGTQGTDRSSCHRSPHHNRGSLQGHGMVMQRRNFSPSYQRTKPEAPEKYISFQRPGNRGSKLGHSWLSQLMDLHTHIPGSFLVAHLRSITPTPTLVGVFHSHRKASVATPGMSHDAVR